MMFARCEQAAYSWEGEVQLFAAKDLNSGALQSPSILWVQRVSLWLPDCLLWLIQPDDCVCFVFGATGLFWIWTT